MRIIFMGTPDFSVGTLEALVEAGHEVVLAVTQPDKPKGRGKEMQFTPVKECALRHGIPVFQPKKVRDPECVEELKKYQADVCVVIAFGQILPKEILEMTPYGCINVHASLLPSYRGAAPIQWAVIRGEKISGDMLEKTEIILDEKETGGSLHDKLAEAGAKLCVHTLDKLVQGDLTPQKQGESPTEYARMLDKKLGDINWEQSAVEIERLIRGLNPWPSAYTHWNGKMLKIWMAEPVTQEELSALGCDEKNGMDLKEAQPGTVMIVTKDTLMVQTGDGLLALTELQMEGKKRMPVQAFLMGCRLQTGEKLERIGRY